MTKQKIDFQEKASMIGTLGVLALILILFISMFIFAFQIFRIIHFSWVLIAVLIVFVFGVLIVIFRGKKKFTWSPDGHHLRVCRRCNDKVLELNKRKALKLSKKSDADPFHCIFCGAKLSLDKNREVIKYKK